jgi:uncharacterized protein YlaI
MSNSLNDWDKQVAAWKLEYKVVTPIKPLTLIRLTEHCRKCGRRASGRHHKGCEYKFAKLDPDRYAPNYVRFRPKDIVWLCTKCHHRIHILYSKRIFGKTFKSYEAERLVYISLCNKWLRRKHKNFTLNRKSINK